ncbi:MAG: terminase large subunit [Hyphomonadaceae bacterium]|nr:terminase large subunit [Clostridia bacterium]
MNHIIEWHAYVKKEPKKHCKAIKQLKVLIENLLKKEEIIYDPSDVEAFKAFCLLLRHTEGEWAGLPLELNLEQKYIAACVLGIKWMDEHGSYIRYFNELILIIARKWGKSTFASALGLYLQCADKENGAQVWCLATVKAQAEIVYKHAVNMALNSPVLKKHVRTRKVTNGHQLEYRTTNIIAAGSKDSHKKDGLNPHGVIIDELHAVKDRNTYDVMKSAMGARRQPLMIIISTSGFERDGIFDGTYNKAKAILTGDQPMNNTFPMIFEIDENDKWDNEKCWIKANPSLGIAPKLRYLQQQAESARQAPEELPSFMAKHLNRASNQSVSFFDLQTINNCAIDMTEDMFKGRYAVGGVDLAETTDLCCASVLVPIGQKLYLFQKYFIASERLQGNSKQDNKDYASFVKTLANDPLNRDLLKICEGSMVKKSDVTEWYIELVEKYNITFWKIGWDRWHGGDWVDEMESKGFPKCDKEMVGVTFPVAMGAKSLSDPMRESRALMKDKKIHYSRHNGLFRWCCCNTAARTDINNGIQPDKSKARARIDGYVSFLIAYIAYKHCIDLFNEFQGG